MSGLTSGKSVEASPTWLTERVGLEQSQLLSGPSFSHTKSSPLKREETMGSDFRRLNWALPGSQWLLQAVPKRWNAISATTAIRIMPSATPPRPLNIGHRYSRQDANWRPARCLSSRHKRPSGQRMSQDIVESHWRWGHGSWAVSGRRGCSRWRQSDAPGAQPSNLGKLAVSTSRPLPSGWLSGTRAAIAQT